MIGYVLIFCVGCLEYLRYAPCIKSTTTERSHCGMHYSLLVEQVEQGGVISKSTLCWFGTIINKLTEKSKTLF